MRKKKILVVDSGGRGHAIVWKLSQSPDVGKIFTATGNAGTALLGENVPIHPTDIDRLAAFAERDSVDLTIVGPERTAALGIGNLFRERGMRIFCPTREAAEIETWKSYSKRLMEKVGIPTPPFEVHSDYGNACRCARAHKLPFMVKASGLADGKGVFKCWTQDHASDELRNLMIDGVLGDAGREVVIEKCCPGDEVSWHALSDGEEHVMFPAAQDHKPAKDGDEGKNTGGMGTIAPVPWIYPADLEEIEDRVIAPTLAELVNRGRPFRGCLFPGGAIMRDGLTVYEFNARFGDPETQSYMRLMKSDLLPFLEACADGHLGGQKIEWFKGYAATIVMVSGGYPGPIMKGYPITGIDEAEKVPGVVVFHAGTINSNAIRTNGGRVLGVSAIGGTLQEALHLAYEGVRQIKFEGMFYRGDIGKKSLARIV